MPNADDDINQIEPKSPDFKTELAKKLQDLAPEAIADGKVDVKKFQYPHTYERRRVNKIPQLEDVIEINTIIMKITEEYINIK